MVNAIASKYNDLYHSGHDIGDSRLTRMVNVIGCKYMIYTTVGMTSETAG